MANEKRLIDANELMDEFRRYMVERYDREKCVSAENCKTCDRGCLWLKIVNNAPTVDAVEVVHGRWIGVDSSYWRWTHGGGHVVEHITYRCSECARKSITETNYCPNCGAKMDGDGNA